MKFENREVEFQGKRKLIEVDENNVPIPNKDPIFVNIVKDESPILVEGTPINIENLNKGNWRDDESVSFKSRSDDELPAAQTDETQLVTTQSGNVWIIPPRGHEAIAMANTVGTTVTINGDAQAEIDFIGDAPQKQITDARDAAVTAQTKADSAQTVANGKSSVIVEETKRDVSFTSDPQTQINNKSDRDSNGRMSDPLLIRDLRGNSITTVFSGMKNSSTINVWMNNIDLKTTDKNPFPDRDDTSVCRIKIVKDGDSDGFAVAKTKDSIGEATSYCIDGEWTAWTVDGIGILNCVYPVGSIYTSAISTNPKVLFGFGTWERFGNGKVMVGVDENDTEFNAVQKTGGEKNVTLTIDQMPNHSHSIGSSGSHTHNTNNVDLQGSFKGCITEHSNPAAWGICSIDPSYCSGDKVGTGSGWQPKGGHVNASHSHSIGSSGGHTHSPGNAGGGHSHNNLPPYITVYLWRRTA